MSTLLPNIKVTFRYKTPKEAEAWYNQREISCDQDNGAATVSTESCTTQASTAQTSTTQASTAQTSTTQASTAQDDTLTTPVFVDMPN